ncbi:MAG: hypothetical protein AMR96_04730 [Candidatus Adiutrix intracellularis]|jgi:hypothetical protein|nr:MAG: hypothetical protein AMR96_04730 [Candidatus Adiutrix intracellularis]
MIILKSVFQEVVIHASRLEMNKEMILALKLFLTPSAIVLQLIGSKYCGIVKTSKLNTTKSVARVPLIKL